MELSPGTRPHLSHCSPWSCCWSCWSVWSGAGRPSRSPSWRTSCPPSGGDTHHLAPPDTPAPSRRRWRHAGRWEESSQSAVSYYRINQHQRTAVFKLLKVFNVNTFYYSTIILRFSLSLFSLVWTTREIGAVIYLDLTLSWQHWLRPQHSSHYIASYGGACSENVFLEHFQCRSTERFQTLKLVWYSADLKARNIKLSIFQFILLLV